MKTIRLIAFILTIIAGMAYPIFKIIRIEYPAHEPVVYRFRSGAVDPYDPFRGRYVTLRPLPDRIPDDGAIYPYNARLYASIGNDSDGLATVQKLSTVQPENGDFIIVKYRNKGVDWENRENADKNKKYHFFNLPFSRYYLNEKLAPEAEKAVADVTRADTSDCILKVKVYDDGHAIIDELEIKGIPLREYLKNRRK